MITRVSPIILFSVVLLAACSPKKEEKPQVGARADAAYAAANEGRAADRPTATPMANTTGSSSATAAAGDSALPLLGPAPSWKLVGLDGKTVRSDDFKGKVVVLDFWATWCPPCREEIPGYVDLYRKYGKDGLAIVGASVDQNGPAVVKDFVAKYSVNYPVVMADEASETAFGGIDAIPTTFLIDRKGQIRDKKVGAEPTDEYEKKILSILH